MGRGLSSTPKPTDAVLHPLQGACTQQPPVQNEARKIQTFFDLGSIFFSLRRGCGSLWASWQGISGRWDFQEESLIALTPVLSSSSAG